jgi:hypothetical protein
VAQAKIMARRSRPYGALGNNWGQRPFVGLLSPLPDRLYSGMEVAMNGVFEQVVDDVMALPFEQQAMLKELIAKWHIEARRAEIAQDAQKSLALFRYGELKPRSATAVIAELRQ